MVTSEHATVTLREALESGKEFREAGTDFDWRTPDMAKGRYGSCTLVFSADDVIRDWEIREPAPPEGAAPSGAVTITRAKLFEAFRMIGVQWCYSEKLPAILAKELGLGEGGAK
jgi:hypothetical protein